KQNGQQQVVEVNYDARAMRWKIKHGDGNGYAPTIVFEPTQQVWVLDLQDAHTLSDSQLIKRMLPNGADALTNADVHTLLRSTSTTRAVLDSVWSGNPAPINLTEGVRRLQADQLINQLINHFHRRGHMPPYADSLVLCLLTQLPQWPAQVLIDVYDPPGTLLETYAKSDPPPATSQRIILTRSDDGTYGTSADTSAAVTQEHLFELILREQPAASTLGKEGSSTVTDAQRITRIRLQVSELAQARRVDLFSALSRYAGFARHEVAATDTARVFVPVKAAPSPVEVTPVLKRLREMYPPLTPANLDQLLRAKHFNSTERAQFLQDGTLPNVLREHLENHRTALRIDAAIDGLYHARAFNADTDLWAREFASSLIRNTLKRHFVITERHDAPYVTSGPDDTTVELRHHGNGHYQAYDMRNGGLIPVSPIVDSFYLAIGSVLQPHERLKLGMTSDTDAQGLRNTLGDLMSAQRSPSGYITLLDQSLGQYAQSVVLPANLVADALGLYELDGQHLVPLYGSLYPVTYDNNRLKWRLRHPKKVGVDTPYLEHNRRGAWRLSSENPLSWDDHYLLYRLGGEDFNVDKPTAQHILKLTGTPARALREVHSAGLAPPPLLADTSKRFRIDREILHFIRAMTTYTANRSARASLQLLLVSALPGWPRSHALEVVDSHGKVLGQYPRQLNHDVEKVRLSEADSHGPEPLKNIVLNNALIEALLGERPATQQEGLFKLAKKIAEHAHQERAQLFDILYRQSEQSATRLEKRLQNHHPALPASAAKAILERASPKERKRLHDHDEVGLRLAEQARLTANDVRLNRAYEGLYLTTLANPDSEKIILHLIKTVSGWPTALRLDIHAGTPEGRLLEHAGNLAGSDRRVLVNMDNGYRAYDNMGQPLGETTDLLGSVADLLTETERQALGVDDSGDLTPLRHRIADLALGQRVAIKALLDLPHLPYWLQPPMAVNSSFTAYPFTLSDLWPFHAHQPVDLVSKVREIYTSFNVARAHALIDNLGMSEPAALIELERRKAEYQAMDYGLTRWAESPHANDDPVTDPLGMNLGQRRYLAEQIRQAWRQETRAAYINGMFDVHVLKLQLGDNDLPDPDFIFGTQGFAHIEYLHIAGDSFPATGNPFLSKFSHLKYLKLDCTLTELPSTLSTMTQLESLHLSDNSIVLTEQSMQYLAALTHLEELHLDNNPLGLAPDITTMTRLKVLSLRNTGLTQWPTGAETRTDLSMLMLQENSITTLPDALFDTTMANTNRNTLLHDNPLDADTLSRLQDYYTQTGVRLGGTLPGIRHQQSVPDGLNDWLTGISPAEQPASKKLWIALKNNEGARSDDAFRVLSDLTKSYAYVKNEASKKALTQRVWHLLNAMGESTELRNDIFLNTYLAGTCGDGAILAFIDMEIRHLRYKAKAQPSSAMADRELLALAQSLFYLRALDQFAEDHLKTLYQAGIEPDDAEVKLYLRMSLAKEFSLPVHQEELLYSAREWVKPRDIADARKKLQDIGKTDAPQTSLLQEDFWLEYLARSYPEPFSTIDTVTRQQVNALNQEVKDKRSDTYLDRRQSITDQEIAERERVVRQLTQAAQLANQRRS
ncbi:NEL-type E3 ubiquitin ligase domain-containing protein, partial [Pseudomonas poae]|uniref:NEL-type E3 ubiquitin ligase domain-containing protein n=1 Tax=Pseudomonas poae TaxID=200451 RepID=UPI00223BDA34